MPAPIANGELGSSARSKINTGFTELATAQTDITGKQATLVSGTNIKTINSTSLLGSGDIAISGSVSDGDKGDITVSASGATWTIDAGVVTLAKQANLAQDQFIGRVTASTGVPETATITAAARTVLDDTTVANMVNTLGGATSTGTGGLARATSPTFVTPVLGTPTSGTLTNCTGLPATGIADGSVTNTEFQYLNTVTSNIQTQIDSKLDAAIATDITDTKTTPVAADALILLDSAASDAPKLTTFGGLRTFMNNKVVGTALATTGTIDLDLAALTGTEQDITLTGNPTFTTSNRVAGRSLELRLGAGGSTRTVTWPGWVSFGAVLPTSIASGTVLRVALYCRGTTDASIDVTSVVSA
jgi:hypothetical protein